MTREFDAPVELVQRAHTDKDLFTRWIGPAGTTVTIDYWDARTGGSWRYVDDSGNAFHGCFHAVEPGRLVQTFTWEGLPEAVSLETMVLTDLGNGRTRLVAQSLLDSFEGRDGMLASGMAEGVEDGYAKLDGLLAELA